MDSNDGILDLILSNHLTAFFDPLSQRPVYLPIEYKEAFLNPKPPLLLFISERLVEPPLS